MLPTQAIAHNCHTLLAHDAAETTDCAGKLDLCVNADSARALIGPLNRNSVSRTLCLVEFLQCKSASKPSILSTTRLAAIADYSTLHCANPDYKPTKGTPSIPSAS